MPRAKNLSDAIAEYAGLVELRIVSHPPPGKRGPYKRFQITPLPPQPGR